MGEPLLSADSTLERVVASRRPLSLYFSRALELRVLGGAVVAAAVIGLTRGWLAGAIVLAVALALASVFVTRRIDLDTDGITLVPLLPLLRPQHVSFAALGRFEARQSRPPAVSAPLEPGATFRVGGLFRRSRLTIHAVYDTAFGDGVLPAADLRAVFEDYRGAASAPAAPRPEPAVAAGAASVSQNEWFAIFGATVAGIVGLAAVALLVVH
jgi:hypothetical protein